MNSDKGNPTIFVTNNINLGLSASTNKTFVIFRDKEAKYRPLHHNSQVTIHGSTGLLICATGLLVMTRDL